ncbi:thioredoxin family protein [Hymenobacter lutimineralis]|uniref:Thioredoxin family protein n=1 Tax=Hymenobacter lutimineralis TaxID=2606448 RepID=A0A5D6UXX8_9BACT|nr:MULTISPECIES: thioredoxin family protein [Hymenobacter]QIX63141.1 thioredoxin family protein [Hymenobacter sp. BT18]TYZ07885.1 thioredoxin family protein [Hymenobacter lutimineralis]
MNISNRQGITDTNDEGLRRYVHDHLKVFVKFTSSNCDICELLAPAFAKFADDAEFEDILFMRLDSDQNPVAKKMMADKIAPFFVAYCQGRVLTCDTLTSEPQVRAMLEMLRHYQPQAA